MTARRIRKVAVLGSGLMGTGIACHLANAGISVLLLDIVPRDLPEGAPKKLRNQLADTALAAALKSKPAPLYDTDFARRIETGNFDDDLARIKDCDWIIEVVVERLDIKQQLFEKVELHRRKGTPVTSNTSGIPIGMMAAGRSDDFKANFLGTHFFNPVRYMRLLEIIPTADTDPALVDFFMQFGADILGKQTVLCVDTPAFIANRVGVYAMAKVFGLTHELGLSIEAADALTGPVLGRPKTGTFRLGDLVGHDTAAHVIRGIKDNCPHDEQASAFEIKPFFQFLLDNKFLGDKTGQGFYKKTGERDAEGRPIILALDLNNLEYNPSQRPKLASLETAKQIEELPRQVQSLFNAQDLGGQLVRRSLCGLFSYAAHRLPEITHGQLYSIDDALRAGFAWEMGPFQYWDAVGVKAGLEAMQANGDKIPAWVEEMIASGAESFYNTVNGKRAYYDVATKSYLPLPGGDKIIVLDTLRSIQKPIIKNAEIQVHDLGDGVACLEFRSKANAIGEGILRGLNETIELLESDNKYTGLVIGNDAANFTVGANLMMVGMLAYQQEFDELNLAVNLFQQTAMRLRYSSIPVVMATQGYVFGGGCEFSMHCDAVIASAESYVGLVEAGVGLIPGGGGTKEFALRVGDSFFDGDVQIPTLIERFKTIATAQVATSASEAFKFGYFVHGKDEVCINKDFRIARAKARVLELAPTYVQAQPRKDVQVLGRRGLGALYAAAHTLQLGGYATEHDIKIAKKMAYVLCGGDLTASQQVSEQYLLDIEREAFLSLLGEQKTLERIQHMLTKGKPLRN
jgi:3-hydroxyacyl-CoA dehydrogenase